MSALTLINHLITQNPEIRQHLSGYNGIVLRIRTAGLILHGRFNRHGLLEASHRPADTELVFRNSLWQNLLQGRTPEADDIELAGDTALGMALLPFIARLRYRPESDLSRLFDGLDGHTLQYGTYQAGRLLKHLGEQLMAYGSESAPVSRSEFRRLADEVGALRSEIGELLDLARRK